MHSAGAPIPPELAEGIRLVVLDVDGVLTDGGILLGATEEGTPVELKRFEITDGTGIRLLRDAGITVALVTGRSSHAVRLRAAELGIDECHQGAEGKGSKVSEMLGRLGIGWDQTAFVGDDLIDLPVLRRVGLPAAVANAAAEVRAQSRWVARRRGGEGAVREFAEALLRARGSWSEAVARYVAEREHVG